MPAAALRPRQPSILIVAAALLAVTASGQGIRPFLLSATTSHAVPGQVPLYQQNSTVFPLQSIASDVDVISVFPEHFGYPVDLFLGSQTPPPNHAWTRQVTSLANAAALTGKPIMLQMALTRDYMVSKAYESNGSLKLDRTWAPRCFDMSTALGTAIGNSYVNYVRWVSNLFKPTYVVIMAEINVYYAFCGGDTASWRALVNIERSAYDAVKASNAARLVFPSFKLEELYGNTLNGFDAAQYNALTNLKRDRFGISTYPYGLAGPTGLPVNPYQLPPDFLSRVKVRYPNEQRLLITETGWNSASISVSFGGSCFPSLLYSDTNLASAYLQHVLYYAYVNDFEIVTWWSARDLVDGRAMSTCYAPVPPGSTTCAGDPWCLSVAEFQAEYAAFWLPPQAELVYKVFGAMGLRTYTGAAKPELMNWWAVFRALPVGRAAPGHVAPIPRPTAGR